MAAPRFHRVWVGIKNSRPQRWRRGWKKNPTWREVAVTYMRWALTHEPGIHYAQIRPFDPRAFLNRALPIKTDCSGSTTMIYRAAGRPDPNGNAYDGTGYTGTLRAHTPKRRSLKACQAGDFIVYGSGTGEHVVVVIEPGKDPLVFSHGQEAGPITTRHSVQVAVHGSRFTCHNGDAL